MTEAESQAAAVNAFEQAKMILPALCQCIAISLWLPTSFVITRPCVRYRESAATCFGLNEPGSSLQDVEISVIANVVLASLAFLTLVVLGAAMTLKLKRLAKVVTLFMGVLLAIYLVMLGNRFKTSIAAAMFIGFVVEAGARATATSISDPCEEENRIYEAHRGRFVEEQIKELVRAAPPDIVFRVQRLADRVEKEAKEAATKTAKEERKKKESDRKEKEERFLKEQQEAARKKAEEEDGSLKEQQEAIQTIEEGDRKRAEDEAAGQAMDQVDEIKPKTLTVQEAEEKEERFLKEQQEAARKKADEEDGPLKEQQEPIQTIEVGDRKRAEDEAAGQAMDQVDEIKPKTLTVQEALLCGAEIIVDLPSTEGFEHFDKPERSAAGLYRYYTKLDSITLAIKDIQERAAAGSGQLVISVQVSTPRRFGQRTIGEGIRRELMTRGMLEDRVRFLEPICRDEAAKAIIRSTWRH
eukprot:TRINITY_DN4552_c0_g1_i1.p1 TRINITY_DN4552_c0_g1~~TRINITY_DN4552_c0_g1_i1.p1  ORF type:complete len:469 (-),score=115.37 TRINITY_DN4552_c0_g1_i1:170-1576(-)